MADAAFHLAGRMAAAMPAHGLPAAVAAALADAVSNWRADAPPAPSVAAAALTAPLQRQLDAFFAGCGEAELFGMAAAAWRQLPWRTGANGKAADVAVVELIGPTGGADSDACRGGVLFQDAGYFYPWHWHAAEEFYLPISGAATWLAAGREAEVVAAEEKLIHHRPWQPHATHTAAAPLLALWLWSGNLDMDTYAFCPPPADASGR